MLYRVKFVDGLPLQRFCKELERHNVPVPSPTLARWVIGGGKLLQPLHKLMRDCVRRQPFDPGQFNVGANRPRRMT